MAKKGEVYFPETPRFLEVLSRFGEVSMDEPIKQGFFFPKYTRCIGIFGEGIGKLVYDCRRQIIGYVGEVGEYGKLLEHLQKRRTFSPREDMSILAKLVSRAITLCYDLEREKRIDIHTDIAFP